MFGLDVNGYDNTPEWGYCEAPGCKEEAFPLWLSGGYPDDPDLLLCPTHIGAHILAAEQARNAALALAETRKGELDGAVEHIKALKAEVAQAWEQAGSDRAALNSALNVIAVARRVVRTIKIGYVHELVEALAAFDREGGV